MDDGTIYIPAFSVQRDDVPVKKDHVRIELDIGGWVLKPDPNNPNNSITTYLAYMDLGGRIPGYIMNMVVNKQPLTILNVSKALSTPKMKSFIEKKKIEHQENKLKKRKKEKKRKN